ncbi:MAG: hypothetical protein IJS36_01305 [Kiritimatiellae bacterium]|nr:hypothetical protein [Kiritimatiellia bacterium]
MANDAIARKHPMNDMKKITDYEIAVERRLEKACERDGWVASAHVSFGADYVDCQLEKFGRDEVLDEGEACRRLEEFVSQEFCFSLADNPKALCRDAEKVPNTIAPYHVTLNAKIPFDVGKVA